MINILVVGKIDKPYYRKAIEEYLKRLTPYTKYKVFEVSEVKPKGNSDKEISNAMQSEGEAILNKCKGYIIVLDRLGREISSVELATTISTLQTKGVSDITFIIGGSNGLSQDVISRSDMTISMGRITYPHQLMRVILAEQIYRAYSIINGSKYHK